MCAWPVYVCLCVSMAQRQKDILWAGKLQYCVCRSTCLCQTTAVQMLIELCWHSVLNGNISYTSERRKLNCWKKTLWFSSGMASGGSCIYKRFRVFRVKQKELK